MNPLLLIESKTGPSGWVRRRSAHYLKTVLWLVVVPVALIAGCRSESELEQGPATPARAFSELVDGLWNHDTVRIERHLAPSSLNVLQQAVGSGSGELGDAVQAVWLPMEGDIRSSSVQEHGADSVTLTLELQSGYQVQIPGQRVDGVWKFELLAPGTP